MSSQIIAAVVHDGAAYGNCDLPLPWWSFTKTVLAAAALALVAQDRLSLDEPVRGQRFTLRQLLQHRAGLSDYASLLAYHKAVEARELPWSTEEMMQKVQADALIFEPGIGWGYSNVGYLLVRQLIEEATGEALDQALRRLIFNPLGIEGVKVATTPDELKHTAWGNASGYHPGWVFHGLLIGTASNAALFLDRLLAGTLLPAPLLMAMLEAHPLAFADPERPWRSTSYGLGLMIGIGEPPGRYIGHTGGGPGSTSAIYHHTSECSTGNTCRTAAAFAQINAPGAVERRALSLAHST
jgi:D-alanyl-D-alanine carboxypeptidase